jgi:tRNA (guanine37-N1)-methyltransferase
MRCDVVTIFPEYLKPLELALVGRARRAGIIQVEVHDLRQWADGPHRPVDASPSGGGPGMVMTPEPWGRAVDSICSSGPAGMPPRLLIPTPGGSPLNQRAAARLATEPWLMFACGRYEGIDARVVAYAAERIPVEELSIGDYVLGGGEAAVIVMIEVISRLIPGVVGNPESVVDDSFAVGAMSSLVEGPVYTKPANWRGLSVPGVLMSGDHAAIARWRRDAALRRTAAHRPELLTKRRWEDYDLRDQEVLAELGFRPTADGCGTLFIAE